MSYKLEKYLLLILWTVFGLNCLFILLYEDQFILFQSERIALAGLIATAIMHLFFRKASTITLFLLLVIGLVNLAEFETWVRFSLGIGLNIPSVEGTSDIQVLSLMLITILISGEKHVIIHFFQLLFNNTEEDRLNEQEARYTLFLRKFDQYTDNEIEKKLQEPLADEAKAALIANKTKRSQKEEVNSFKN